MQLLPDGTTLEQIAALLSDELQRDRSQLVRDRPDQMRLSPILGTRFLFASLRAVDLRQPYATAWGGAAELSIQRDDAETPASVQISVSGYSGSRDEGEAANMAWVVWRLADALEHAFWLTSTAERAG